MPDFLHKTLKGKGKDSDSFLLVIKQTTKTQELQYGIWNLICSI